MNDTWVTQTVKLVVHAGDLMFHVVHLEPGTEYAVRAGFDYENGSLSAWSVPVEVSTPENSKPYARG